MLDRRALIGATAASLALPHVARAADRVGFGYIGDYQNASLPAIAVDQRMWEAEGWRRTSRCSPTARSRSRP